MRYARSRHNVTVHLVTADEGQFTRALCGHKPGYNEWTGWDGWETITDEAPAPIPPWSAADELLCKRCAAAERRLRRVTTHGAAGTADARG